MATNATDKTTADAPYTDDALAEAREYYHDVHYLGTDGAGATHFWSRYHQAVVCVEADTTATVELPVRDGAGTIDDLRAWITYTRHERGWVDLRVSGGLFEDLDRVLEGS